MFTSVKILKYKDNTIKTNRGTFLQALDRQLFVTVAMTKVSV
jgi:hypothetical protein